MYRLSVYNIYVCIHNSVYYNPMFCQLTNPYTDRWMNAAPAHWDTRSAAAASASASWIIEEQLLISCSLGWENHNLSGLVQLSMTGHA